MRKIKLYTNPEITDRGDQYMARAIDLEEMDEDYDYIEYTVFWDIITTFDKIRMLGDEVACDWEHPSEIIESPYWCSQAVRDEIVIVYDDDNKEMCRFYEEG